MRLVGTTKSTIAAIRERTHWNAASLAADGPGDFGPLLADRPRSRSQRANKEKPAPADTGATLLPAAETTAEGAEDGRRRRAGTPGELDVSAVFAKLKQLGGGKKAREEEAILPRIV